MALTYTPNDNLGAACPDFELPGVDGRTYSLTDFTKVGTSGLLVMFICNHCPYVKAIEDRLIQLAKDLKRFNVPVLAICSNDEDSYPEDNFENLKKRWKEKEYPFVYLQDKTQKVARNFGAVCTPDFFGYDKNLKLAYRGRLDDSWKEPEKVTKRELYEALVKLSQGKYLDDGQTPSMGCNIKWLKS